jgi:hypothetical protein
MEVSCHLHSPATLPPEKKTGYPLDRRLDEPRSSRQQPREIRTEVPRLVIWRYVLKWFFKGTFVIMWILLNGLIMEPDLVGCVEPPGSNNRKFVCLFVCSLIWNISNSSKIHYLLNTNTHRQKLHSTPLMWSACDWKLSCWYLHPPMRLHGVVLR